MAIYPKAQWHGPVPNQGGKMDGYRLGVVHIMQGSLNGSDGWFHNNSAQVSAHFGIGKDGTVYQWVDTANVAWAEANYNGVGISIECEGYAGEALTGPQAFAVASLMKWVRKTHGIPLVRNTNPAAAGWIGHGELGAAGGGHLACPGQPVLDQIPGMLVLAAGGDPFKGGRGPAAPVTLPSISRGASGMAVRTLQQHLNISVDGVFGPATEASVKLFQQNHHLTTDGVVGPQTWSALGV